MRRTLVISGLFVGSILTVVLFSAPMGVGEGAIHHAGVAAPLLHSPPGTRLLPGGHDNCDRFREGNDRDDGDEGRGRGDLSRIRRGFAIAPVPLNLEGKDCALVGLGSYLVNTNECVDCHTRQDGQPAWFVTGGNPFLGQPEQINTAHYLWGGGRFMARDLQGNLHPVISRNLTPDASGLPAGYTLERFLLVMHTGIDLKNLEPHIPSAEHDLLQVMPWTLFDDLTDHDLRAMYEYLSAIPCVEGPPASIYPNLPPHPCN